MEKKQEISTEKILIYAGISFTIVLALVGIFLYTTQKQAERYEFFEEYNETYEGVRSLVDEHDLMINDINVYFGEPVDTAYYERLRDYVKWVEKNKDEFYDFQHYIELNYQKISDLGENPDYRRDNIKTVIDLMYENSEDFQEEIITYEQTQQESNYFDEESFYFPPPETLPYVSPSDEEEIYCGVFEILKNGECISCGDEDERCCNKDACFGIFPSLMCQGGTCVSCGDVGLACCGGNECNSIFPSSICVGGTCERCGGEYEQCCGNNECDFLNSCQGGICRSCGFLDEPCCSQDSPTLCYSGECIESTCQLCGAVGYPCCPGDQCLDYHECIEGVCEIIP